MFYYSSGFLCNFFSNTDVKLKIYQRTRAKNLEKQLQHGLVCQMLS